MAAAPVAERPRLVEPVEPVEIEVDAEWGVYEITPEVARYWLTKNTRNMRNISPRVVDEYARDIEHGAWPLNYQPITFRKDGSLDNGQHRLEAVIKANTAIVSLVVWGVDNEVYDTVDIGLKRTATQIIGVENPRYATHMASASALVWRLEQPNPQRALLDNAVRPTMHDRLETLARHNADGELFASVEFTMSKCSNLMKFAGSTATAQVIHYFGARKHGRKAADRFYQLLNTGLAGKEEPALTANHPAYRLRETLQRLKRDQTRVRQPFAYGLWLTAWNAYATGEMLRRLPPLDYTTNPDLTIQ